MDTAFSFFNLLLDFFQILILAVPLYYLLKFLRVSKGNRILLGFSGALVGVWMLAFLLRMDEISWILDHFVYMLPLSFVIIFQPELRKLLGEFGTSRKTQVKTGNSAHVGKIITSAVSALSKMRIGALIAVERRDSLDEYMIHGRELEAPLVSELLVSIFYPNTPMHDGGVIIRKDRIVAAGCIFPLSNYEQRRRAFGTRHRAAIGLSEQTDALVVVVSEESGLVSMAYNGRLVRGLSDDTLQKVVSAALENDRGFIKSFDSADSSETGPDVFDSVFESIRRLKEDDEEDR